MEIRNIANLLKSTVSISLFNKGLAGKIFDDVKKNGTKIVIKNNVPECILISPEDYLNLIEKIEELNFMKWLKKELLKIMEKDIRKNKLWKNLVLVKTT